MNNFFFSEEIFSLDFLEILWDGIYIEVVEEVSYSLEF